MSCNLPITDRRPSTSGFTLLEVMIALAIISATLIVSLYTINYHADVAYGNTVKTHMIILAKEKLRMLEISREKSKGAIKGTVYSYENDIRKTAFDEIIQLRTVIKNDTMVSTLSKLVLKKGGEEFEEAEAEE
jgi:prepilin-type N-terminal cleavage/methylation domain-containing protein